MALRNFGITTTPLRLLPSFAPSRQYVRCLHKTTTPENLIPPPTPFVPNTTTFLTLIGRNMAKHAPKLSSWDALFTLTSPQLKDLGIEPARSRKYLLRWRNRFREQRFGIGGDLEHVVDGVGEVRVVEVPTVKKGKGVTGGSGGSGSPPLTTTGTATLSPGKRWAIVNIPPGEEVPRDLSFPLKKYAGVKLVNGNALKAPYLELIKGADGMAGRIRVIEGMWEDKLGRKVDGGERRRAEVRAKRRSQERRNGTA
ncbi:hypothetical protein FQN50_007182 [Emmonsiellopsis sp. PD_5]|nr:hypothetical protein FQN50_007182 [Emmonsiellopsis sp. PD_5]